MTDIAPRMPDAEDLRRMARLLFLEMPSRLLSRLRTFDDIFEQPSPASDTAEAAASQASRTQLRTRESGLAPLPGPWGFLTSGYFVGIFFMVCALCSTAVASLMVLRRSS